MDYISVIESERGGFDFDHAVRNATVASGCAKYFMATKTGTTICGVVCKDAVVIGADTRATAGSIVADKNCSKIHKLADNIYCGGAGTAADLEHTTAMIAAQLELHARSTKTKPRVAMAVRRASSHLFKYQGHVGCALVLGGFDLHGPQLYQIYPHGSTDCLPFTSMGSGSLAAMAVLESKFKDNLSTEEGAQLVAEAIRSGVMNDLGSGGNVDIIIMTRDGNADHKRAFLSPSPRTYTNPKPYIFPHGTTPILVEVNKDGSEMMTD
jgi:20S proteasome subunit beta 2